MGTGGDEDDNKFWPIACFLPQDELVAEGDGMYCQGRLSSSLWFLYKTFVFSLICIVAVGFPFVFGGVVPAGERCGGESDLV